MEHCSITNLPIRLIIEHSSISEVQTTPKARLYATLQILFTQRRLNMSSSPTEPQDLPKVQEPTASKDKQSARNILAALVIICIIGMPLIYSLAHSSGANSGYSGGYNVGYSEGYSEGHDAGRFDFYYVKPNQRYGVDELDNYLKSWKWTLPYQESVFDCSEMSACLERDLENEGFHTVIVVGNSPFGSGRHAWLLVEASVGKYMPVEATNRQVIWWSSPYFDNYFKYDHRFETIQEALAYSSTGFDWWNAT